MKTQKMSLANIMGKLSRAEMKKIMAGSSDCLPTYSCGCPGVSGSFTCCGSTSALKTCVIAKGCSEHAWGCSR